MIGDDLARGLPDLQGQAESLMRERIRITRVAGMVEDVGGREVPNIITAYEGRAGYGTHDAQTVYAEIAGASVAVQQQVIKVPSRGHSYTLVDGDIAEFLPGSTPAMVGKRMRLVGAMPAKSWVTQWSIQAEWIV